MTQEQSRGEKILPLDFSGRPPRVGKPTLKGKKNNAGIKVNKCTLGHVSRIEIEAAVPGRGESRSDSATNP